jgi:hypothetical protein
MFVQIIQGKVADESRLRAQMDRWLEDLAPGADGWLGGTYGITDDGMLLAMVRFESEDAARRNSDRPEQGRWWQDTETCFEGSVTFHDCRDVHVLLKGGSDDAGFVQVIQGRVRDKERVLALEQEGETMMAEHRPDIIGVTIAVDDDGTFTEVVSFTSEAAAREGERREMTPDMERLIREEMSLLEDTRYLDLHHPWFASAPSR